MAVNDVRIVLCAFVFGFAAYYPIRTQPPPNWPGWNQNNLPPNWPMNQPMPPPNWPGWWNNNNGPTPPPPTPSTTRMSMVDLLYCNMMCDDYDYDRAASSTSMEDLMDAVFGDPCEDCPTRPPTTTPRMSMNFNVFPSTGMNMTMMRNGDNWMMNVWPMATPAPNSASQAPNSGSNAPNTGSPAPNTGPSTPNTGSSTPNSGSPSGNSNDNSTSSGIEELLPKNYLIFILLLFHKEICT